MKKHYTALSGERLLNLIGKPRKDRQYDCTDLPPVKKLLKQYNFDPEKVYPYYKVLKKIGWVTVDENVFRRNVRKQNKLLCAGRSDAGDYDMMSELNLASEGQLGVLKQDLAEMQKQLSVAKTDKFIAQTVIESIEASLQDVKPAPVSLNIVKATCGKSRNMNEKYYNILPIADVHYGEFIDSRAINGKNNYNTAIAKKRHQMLFERNYEFASIYGCDDLHIFFLGDIFSGNIHQELRETNERVITDCLIDYYEFIVGLINEYAKLYKTVTISCVVGNHARNTEKFRFKNKGKDSYEYILYGLMRSYYAKRKANTNVTVNLTDSVVNFVKVGKQVWKIEHGDRYRGGSAFVSPLGIVARDNFKDKGIYGDDDDQDFDAVMMGHFHKSAEVYLDGSNIPIYLNASMVGPGEFAVHNCHSSYPAESSVLITDGQKVIAKSAVNLMSIQR